LQNHQQLRLHKELLVIMEFSQAVEAVVVIPPQMGRELVDPAVVEMAEIVIHPVR
tara:strand:+ start:255 stop:419 length:165 start_codon:yes stop_codon:yes gene_type:complete